MEAIKCPEKWRTITKDNIVVRDKVEDWLYIFDEVNVTYFYLIIGEEKALLFDTGYAFTDFRPLVSEITDKPLYVVCSHGHDDHVLGCSLYSEAYLSEADFALCKKNDNPEQLEKQIIARRESAPDIDNIIDREEYYKTSFANTEFKPLRDGDTFDLGGITLVCYPVPGHTKGSITLYCPEKKALFSGDCMMKNHPLIYGQSLAISSEPQEFIRGLSRLEKLDIDIVWPAHGNAPVDKSLVVDTRAMLVEWARNGDIERDRDTGPRPTNNPFIDPNAPRNGKYKYKDLVLGYHPGHLEQVRAYMAEHDGAVE